MPRLTLTRAKVCGLMPGGVASPCHGPSAGVTDPSTFEGVVRTQPPARAKLVGSTG